MIKFEIGLSVSSVHSDQLCQTVKLFFSESWINGDLNGPEKHAYLSTSKMLSALSEAELIIKSYLAADKYSCSVKLQRFDVKYSLYSRSIHHARDISILYFFTCASNTTPLVCL